LNCQLAKDQMYHHDIIEGENIHRQVGVSDVYNAPRITAVSVAGGHGTALRDERSSRSLPEEQCPWGKGAIYNLGCYLRQTLIINACETEESSFQVGKLNASQNLRRAGKYLN